MNHQTHPFQNIQRCFVIENQQTQQTKIIKGSFAFFNAQVDIKHILEQIEDLNICIYKIYDPRQKKYRFLKDLTASENIYCVPYSFLEPQIILLKYNLDTTETSSLKSSKRSLSDNSSVKKQRSKERTIAEIIQIVKQWRQIHLNPVNGKKINLQEAAAMLGISKKSLDDYYYQLRLGEKYDFDFKNNLHEKVGMLRTFIKQTKPLKKNEKQIKAQKHPKKLKIIQQLGDIHGSRKKYEHFSAYEMIPEIAPDNEMDEQKNQRNSIEDIENQFYNEFDYLGDQPVDPFLNFEGSFKKKNEDDLSEQLFF